VVLGSTLVWKRPKRKKTKPWKLSDLPGLRPKDHDAVKELQAALEASKVKRSQALRAE